MKDSYVAYSSDIVQILVINPSPLFYLSSAALACHTSAPIITYPGIV